MFESLKQTLADLLGGRIAPAARRDVINSMKAALVQAKMGVEDLAEGVAITRKKLEAEREALTTAARRRGLAEGIADTETAQLAAKYEAQHSERVAVLERKLEAEEAEFAIAERDYDEMFKQLKQANAGVGTGMSSQNRPLSDADLGLRDDAPLNAELDGLSRTRQRVERDAQADAALDALKKKMRGE